MDRTEFKTGFEQGYEVIIDVNSTSPHIMGGRPLLAEATCPNCALSLTRFLHIDCKSAPFTSLSQNWTFIELLYCWQCSLSQSPFSYKITENGELELVSVCKGDVVSEFPYENYPRWFTECRVEMKPLEARFAKDLELFHQLSVMAPEQIASRWSYSERDLLTTPFHQVGGIPFLNDYSPACCPSCSEGMQFIATIAYNSVSGELFVDSEYVQVVYFVCQKCNIVTARQDCD